MTNHTVHKYEYLEIGKNKWQVYKCVLPDCTHRIPVEDIINRTAECWRCGSSFTVTKKLSGRNRWAKGKDGKNYVQWQRKPSCGCHLVRKVTNKPKPSLVEELLQKYRVK